MTEIENNNLNRELLDLGYVGKNMVGKLDLSEEISRLVGDTEIEDFAILPAREASNGSLYGGRCYWIYIRRPSVRVYRE
jgi:hypothetical protein